MVFNFHSHCRYCDGKGNPEDFLTEAVNQKFAAFGFSSHSPLPFDNDFSLKQENATKYVDEINFLKKKYADILPVFVGLECDFIPNISTPFQQFKETYQLDYIIGGVHLVKKDDQLWFIDGSERKLYDDGLEKLFNNNIKKAVGTYFQQLLQMIDTEQFNVVAHLDKIKMHNQNRFFSEDEKWYIDWIEQTLALVKEKQLIVEINTRGLYKKRCDTFYPSPWIIKRLKELSIPVTISTDSHHHSEISLYFNEAKQCLKDCGIQEIAMLTRNGWDLVING